MVFSSVTFLFFFLPLILAATWGSGRRYQNPVLLLGSLFFYGWGEGIYVLLMLASIAVNFACGRLIEAARATNKDTLILIVGVSLNLLILGYFKYANFLWDNVHFLFTAMGFARADLDPVRLPIGISFFTFQALSYLIDVYRKEAKAQQSPINLGLYISLFPQLIAGPIVRYQTISDALEVRSVTMPRMVSGIERFLFGLSKKVLLANPLGQLADTVFALPTAELATPLAWLGAGCYTLQIYYDFSGYSDMAIGLGRMFGFHFLENFNYPYISRSLREFWRRWHISLSTWLRDYVYFPLGGNRKGAVRTYCNLVIVFFLCGLWHGANWTFVVWGLYHGFFLILERTPIFRLHQRLRPCFQRSVTLLIVIFGWVIFRSETLPEAMSYIGAMLGSAERADDWQVASFYINRKLLLEFGIAILLSMPLYPRLTNYLHRLTSKPMSPTITQTYQVATYSIKFSVMVALTYFSIISLAAGVYNPFIYFRF